MRSEECQPGGVMEHRTPSPLGDPIVASVFQEEPLINLTAAVHDEFLD